jgi:hypothetical protein
MSILERLNLGIKSFKPAPKRERTDYKTGPERATYNPSKPPPAMQKALDARRKQEQKWSKRKKARRQASLERYPSLRTYLATLKASATDTSIIYDGVLDLDVHALIEELKLQELPDSAKHVALDATRKFVSDVHTIHYGQDNGDEIPWDLPEGITYTAKEAQNALWPNGITYNFQTDDEPSSLVNWFSKKKVCPPS